MKKITVVYLVSMIAFAACTNNGSSTVGTYENDETSSASTDKKDDPIQEATSNSNTENAGNASIDTAKNITGVSRDSVTSKNKKDTSFAAEKKNVKIQKTKKVNLH